MLKLINFLFIFLLTTAQVFAVEIKGKVLNLGGLPVDKAAILHHSSGMKTLTDENGLFSLNVPQDEKFRLEVTHPDYIEQEVILTEKDLRKRITITLVPYIIQREEVVVTAMRHPESSSSVPAAETVVPTELLQEEMPPNITEGISATPGVSSIGAGGFSLVPNIRGLARRRVLILIDNARVTSDRRTGPNASFVNPKDIERIEVLRSPSSVLYGSDAIGGVIHILTKKPSLEDGLGGRIYTKYGTINQEKGFGISLEGGRNKNTGFYLSFQANDAENYSSPSGEILQSQFTQGSVIAKVSHVNEKRKILLSFLGARGQDIGKANQSSSTKPTWYPKENQIYLQLQWLEKGIGKGDELNFQAFINPNYLETQRDKYEESGYKSKESYTKVESLNFGAHLSYVMKINNYFHLRAGADIYGRSSVESYARDRLFDSSGNLIGVQQQWPFTQGRRNDLGFFLSVDYSGIKKLDLVGGIRLDFIRMKALPENTPPSSESENRAWTGFIAGSWKITDEVIAFANVSKAYRVASLNELFYTGITGRGFIIAQPGLVPETSFNLDGGLKFIFKRFFFGVYAFYYEIDGLIERYLIDEVESIYTYGNVNQGRISGYELEMEFYPIPKWKLFGNFFAFEGRSTVTGAALNDVPSPRLFLGTRVWFGRISSEINATFQMAKDDPGPAEIGIPAYQFVNLKATYHFKSSFRLYLILSNVLNQNYIARPDPDAVEEPGLNFVFGASYAF
jgi:outer membrane receptor protein involved in Fe transport